VVFLSDAMGEIRGKLFDTATGIIDLDD
jgi:hypothetical protein